MNNISIVELSRMVAFADTSYGNDNNNHDIILYCGDYKVTIGFECIAVEKMLTPNHYFCFPIDENLTLEAEQDEKGFTSFHFDTSTTSITIEFTNKVVAKIYNDNERAILEENNLLTTLM